MNPLPSVKSEVVVAGVIGAVIRVGGSWRLAGLQTALGVVTLGLVIVGVYLQWRAEQRAQRGDHVNLPVTIKLGR